MRRRLVKRIVWLALVVAGCGDSPFGPNTDIGLRVWVEITPASVGLADSLATVTVRLNVYNPRDEEIRVVSGGPPYVFAGDPSKSQGLWGSIRIGCNASPTNCGPNVDWWGDSVYVIPSRTTHYDETTFTLQSWRSLGWSTTPGAYQVRGWFNAREGTGAILTLKP